MKFAFFPQIFYFVLSIHTANNYHFMYSQKSFAKPNF